METPKTENRRITPSKHVPTPKISARKKCLFNTGHSLALDDSELGSIRPIKFNNSNKRSPAKAVNTTSFRNMLGNCSPDSDRSLSPDFEKRFSHSERYEFILAYDKENQSVDEDTRLSFPDNTLIRTPTVSTLIDETNSNSLSQLMSLDLNIADRIHEMKTPAVSEITKRKELKHSSRKLNFQNESDSPTKVRNESEISSECGARPSFSFNDIRPISTKSFYSSKNKIDTLVTRSCIVNTNVSPKCTVPKKRPKKYTAKRRSNSVRLGSLNRGVFHKIKKPSTKTNFNKKILVNQVLTSPSSLVRSSEKLISFPPTLRAFELERLNNHERIKQIYQQNKNPIDQAKPLFASKSMNDVNCIQNSLEHYKVAGVCKSSEDLTHDTITDNNVTKRKFFKSNNRRIKLEYKIVNNVSATVQKGGKISLNESKGNKRKLKSVFDEDIDFDAEQLEVENIISKLTDFQKESNKDECDRVCTIASTESECNIIESAHGQMNTEEEISNDDPIPLQPNIIFFDRSSPVVDDLAATSNELNPLFAKDTGNLKVIDQRDNLFPVFHKELQRGSFQAQAIMQQCDSVFSRLRQKRQQIWRPIGHNQYQIDAGQKRYGAYQCPECDLVYSLHEPEEELIHQNFHDSMHTLKFNGWIDEVVVTYVPEWDITGRIIAVSTTDSKQKLNKLQEILRVVDRELGYSTPSAIQSGSITYIALAKSTILGICVAQPLQNANRLLTIEGLQESIDCCTVETYPARCGISRIWVSPKYRRLGIARKLLTVVKSHFIFGYLLTNEEIAFSAPTISGKELAESITGRKDFLIYF